MFASACSFCLSAMMFSTSSQCCLINSKRARGCAPRNAWASANFSADHCERISAKSARESVNFAGAINVLLPRDLGERASERAKLGAITAATRLSVISRIGRFARNLFSSATSECPVYSESRHTAVIFDYRHEEPRRSDRRPRTINVHDKRFSL